MTDEFLAEIGRITWQFTILDELVVGVIGKLLASNQEVGQVVCASLTASARRELLGKLFGRLRGYGISADVEGLEAILALVAKAAETRNHVMHAVGFFPGAETAGNISQWNRSRKGSITSQDVSVADLRKAASEIEDAREKLGAFMIRHFQPYGSGAAWASPFGPGTEWGVGVQLALAWREPYVAEAATSVLRDIPLASPHSEAIDLQQREYLRDVLQRNPSGYFAAVNLAREVVNDTAASERLRRQSEVLLRLASEFSARPEMS
jgi:hypothetical protein